MAAETDVDGETGTDPERDGETTPDVDTDHLSDVPDGCGCAEVWEHTSDLREE